MSYEAIFEWVQELLNLHFCEHILSASERAMLDMDANTAVVLYAVTLIESPYIDS